ncbi:MAG: hypothetical protein ACWGQW_20580, partial [bacterium]
NGSRLRIHGVDNPDSLRGMYFDGVVLDEYGLFPANAWSEVIWPMLTDRQGWALMMGTPNGKNDFYTKAMEAKGDKEGWFFAEYPASVTGLIDGDELARARDQMTDDEYRQEYECSFEAAVKGSIYGKDLELAESEGRIGSVPADPALPVDTDWDLGIGDSMAIWFSQSLRSGEVHLIDYVEGSGEGFPFYAQVLDSKGYAYGRHWAPHDITVRELGTGRSRLEVAREFGIRFEVTPRIHKAQANEVEEGIHAVRMLLGKCFFDRVKCKDGIEALRHYRRDYNQRLDEFKASPVHDWASHGADAFRGLAVRHRIPQEKKEKRAVQMPREWTWS